VSKKCGRREFIEDLAKFPCVALLMGVVGPIVYAQDESPDADGHYYAMGIQVDRCIGCGLCVQACKSENDVPKEPYFFRTWVERYSIHADGEVEVESP